MGELFVDGAWIEGEGPRLHSIDPATGARVWQGRQATEAQVDTAVMAARRAFSSWQGTPLGERIEVLRRFARLVEEQRDHLARVISLETGKPTWEALTEVDSMVGKVAITVQAYAERTGTREQDRGGVRSVVRHRPHGVLGALGPYNFPCHLPNGHIVPALLAGNTLSFKPSEHTPWSAIETVALWERAGLPPGVLNLVLGEKEAGSALVEHPQLDGLLFTGSAATGHRLHERFGGHPETLLALEMGGNNPLVVDAIEDIDAAVLIIVQSAYLTAGQRCTCARRLFVPNSPFGRSLVDRLVEVTESLEVGPFDAEPTPFMGPVISEQAADALLDTQSRIVGLGGNALVPMRKLQEGTGLLSPGLIEVTGASGIPDEEHFGPLVQLHVYESFDQAIAESNATRFGLAAGLISEDRAKWEAFVARIRAGIINWNRPLTGASSAAPFGGVGASGNHRPSAYYAADYCAYPVASLEQNRVSRPDTLPPGVSL